MGQLHIHLLETIQQKIAVRNLVFYEKNYCENVIINVFVLILQFVFPMAC